MKYKDVRTTARWPAAALVIAFCVAVVAAGWMGTGSDRSLAHGAHALPASVNSTFAVIAEHQHAEDGSRPVKPEAVARAVLPRVATSLAALGVVATIAIVAAFWGHTATNFIRGPPRAVANVIQGQLLLTHLCIARR